MMTISMIIAAVLICLGVLFMLASLIGIVRLPDFFTRLHAQGVGDTLGAFLILAGMIAAVGAGLLSIKILLIFIIIVLTNPIGTNLMMIAAINKEDYQGYSTLMSGGNNKNQGQEPAAKAEEPEVKEQETALKAEEPEVKEQGTAAKTEEPEMKEPKGDRKPKGNNRKPKGERKPKAENKKPDGERKPKAESKKPDGERKLKAENKKPKDEQKEQKERQESKKKSGHRKSNKPSMRMNRPELLAAANKRGIEVPEGATKREILDLIYSNKDKNRN